METELTNFSEINWS